MAVLPFNYSINFRKIINARVTKCRELIEMRATSDTWNAVPTYDREIVMMLNHMHDTLHEVTREAKKLPKIRAAWKGEIKPSMIEFIERELTFIDGAVHDPYLFATEQEEREAAILGLKKARRTLEKRIKEITE